MGYKKYRRAKTIDLSFWHTIFKQEEESAKIWWDNSPASAAVSVPMAPTLEPAALRQKKARAVRMLLLQHVDDLDGIGDASVASFIQLTEVIAH